jgi:TfoX/Sxy family transcriptional regulator of competence genes
MAYDEGLAQRMREMLDGVPALEEKKMFGGVGFLVAGNMACGVNQEDLIVRVGPEAYYQALQEAYTKEFDMTGRPMRGWVVVQPDGYEADEDLQAWIQRGLEFASSLPVK